LAGGIRADGYLPARTLSTGCVREKLFGRAAVHNEGRLST
jgi:hypothetical protein